MNALVHPPAPIQHAAAIPLLRTLVLCDIVDSTALTQRLGDQRAADLFRKHDRLARALLPLHGGREIDKTDGFLLMFERPVQAVAFALDYQRALRDLNEAEGSTLATRVGIHVGDVVAWDNSPEDIARGAKLIEVEGLVKPITSRLMQLALPGQILLSGVAHALAHRAQGELGERLERVRWRTHGRYRFKGVPDPIPVFEVGDEGFAPLKAPPWSGKAHREVPFWRRPATLGIELTVLLLMLVIPAWYLLRPASAIAFAQRDWVVVGDLKNLTGDARFDESIETAFRIGLEQSRYVNVLSSLKTRETIRLMQKDPSTTAVDRVVGAEVALRDGARALILPTIAEIGGRVRVTAEVVDPNTQTTVYSESADGIGAESVLASLDMINQKLRVRLGEAMATVSKDSQPLESVTTSSLDALKAYTIGERVYATGSMDEARALYRQALVVDPGFALAHIALARVAMNVDQAEVAKSEMAAALAQAERLSPMDKLYAEALQATMSEPRAALDKLRMLNTLYPGRYEGIYGYFAWQDGNRFEDAIAALEKSVIPQNPYRATSEYVLGALYLGMERYADAVRAFADAKASGLKAAGEFSASAYAAQRDYAKANATLAELERTVPPNGEISLARLCILLDQGQWPAARALISAGTKKDAGVAADVDAAIAVALGTGGRFALSTTAEDHPAAKVGASPFRTLFRAYADARRGDVAASRKQLEAVGDGAELDRQSLLLADMRAVARAELQRASGNAKEAVSILRATVDGSELLIVHAALVDAYESAGDREAALKEARYLAGRRGRAYAEYNADRVLSPYNVVQATVARLRSAELLAALGRKADADAELAAFHDAWKDAAAIPELAQRAAKLSAAR